MRAPFWLLAPLLVVAACAEDPVTSEAPIVPQHRASRVSVCHVAGTGTFRLISIADPALASHIRHGDAQPGDAVPAQPGKKFTSSCAIVALVVTPDIILVHNTTQFWLLDISSRSNATVLYTSTAAIREGDLHPDGDRVIYRTISGGHMGVEFRMSTGVQTASIGEAWYPSYSRGGDSVVAGVTGPTMRIYQLRPTGAQTDVATCSNGYPRWIDGDTKLLCATNLIWTYDLTSGTSTPVDFVRPSSWAPGAWLNCPRLSSDGTTISFSIEATYQFYLINRDGSNLPRGGAERKFRAVMRAGPRGNPSSHSSAAGQSRYSMPPEHPSSSSPCPAGRPPPRTSQRGADERQRASLHGATFAIVFGPSIWLRLVKRIRKPEAPHRPKSSWDFILSVGPARFEPQASPPAERVGSTRAIRSRVPDMMSRMGPARFEPQAEPARGAVGLHACDTVARS